MNEKVNPFREVEKQEQADWLPKCVDRLRQLPEPLQFAGRMVLVVDENGKEFEQGKDPTLKQCSDIVFSLSAEDRNRVFTALLPKLGRHLEAGQQLLIGLPTRLVIGTPPYRAPSRETWTRIIRIKWLIQMVGALARFGADAEWLATWGCFLDFGGMRVEFGILLAAVLNDRDEAGDRLFVTLQDCAMGRHAVGRMNNSILVACLASSREEAWSFVEKLLLAAQREEGLRTAILASASFAQPEPLRRMMRLLLEENLVRFSSVAQVLNDWFGYRWDAASTAVFRRTLEKALRFLEDTPARQAAWQSRDPEEVYLALWAQACDDLLQIDPPVKVLLNHTSAEMRLVGVHLYRTLMLDHVDRGLVGALDDLDWRVVARGLELVSRDRPGLKTVDVFAKLEALLKRLPDKPVKVEPAVWPWMGTEITRGQVIGLMLYRLGSHPATDLLPYAGELDVSGRERLACLLCEANDYPNPRIRRTLLDYLADASPDVRKQAIRGLKNCVPLAADEQAEVEDLLKRQSSDLRRGVLEILLKQDDESALASARRLLAAKPAPMRLAGLELLRLMVEKGIRSLACRQLAEEYRKGHPSLADTEEQHLAAILPKETAQVVSLDDSLGLARREDRTWPESPQSLAVKFHSPVSKQIALSLEDLIEKHKETPVRLVWRDFIGTEHDETKLLGLVGSSFPDAEDHTSVEDARRHLPLAELWTIWWKDRQAAWNDEDGLGLLRTYVWFWYLGSAAYERKKILEAMRKAAEVIYGDLESVNWRYGPLLNRIIKWLIHLNAESVPIQPLLDLAESALAIVPPDYLGVDAAARQALIEKLSALQPGTGSQIAIEQVVQSASSGLVPNWRAHGSPYTAWLYATCKMLEIVPANWDADAIERLWRLFRWLDEPVQDHQLADGRVKLPRVRPPMRVVLLAREAGAATDADVIDRLIGFRGMGAGLGEFRDFAELTKRAARVGKATFMPFRLSVDRHALEQFPFLGPLVDRCRDRVLDVELARGDTPTPASTVALAIQSLSGTHTLIRVIRALGDRPLSREWKYGETDKETVFSAFIRRCFPASTDTPEIFAQLVKEARIPTQRLVDVAVYAPQWARFVEHALGGPQFAEAVYWIHAHTKDTSWDVDDEIKNIWKAEAAYRTPLSADDLLDGAVDVEWFRRIHAALPARTWDMLDEAAKYAATGSGHARVRLAADALLGRIAKAELVKRIQSKRNQDAVRTLGLLALAKGRKAETDLLERYERVQEFLRTSKQFGAQRRASEKRAAQIGLDNLARTAGYPDPIRLQWAMEARAVADLADGPISVTADGTTVSLGVDVWGEVGMTVTRNGQPLKDVPSALKQHKEIKELRERKVELKRQAARIRASLETLMVRGDTFTGSELPDLMKHPLLAPMLRALVLVGDGIKGYPAHGGKALEDHAGGVEALKKNEALRIAHPHDLLPAGEWHRWQKDCFVRERVQPFKQVFREYYPLTVAEKVDDTLSRRYAGHQLQPRQAVALLGQRGWVAHPEEGVSKTFHESGLTVWIEFLEGWCTPADVEGLTLEGVYFVKRGEFERRQLTEVPPRLFSEVMRDLDLVVSVAHRGGVDPEASASTVEMRAALLRELLPVLELANVRLEDRHALIEGKFGRYSVHLGSAVTHRLPGGMVFIVPVHSQHRGRMFLPFADDDPKTAEVMSKVLLLARDHEIKDPAILDQIVR